MSIKLIFAALFGALYAGAAAALEWNLQPAGSKMAADIHRLHEEVMVLCTAIFVGVFGFMFYSVLRAPQVQGPQGGPVPREHHGRDPLDRDPGHDPGGASPGRPPAWWWRRRTPPTPT